MLMCLVSSPCEVSDYSLDSKYLFDALTLLASTCIWVPLSLVTKAKISKWAFPIGSSESAASLFMGVAIPLCRKYLSTVSVATPIAFLFTKRTPLPHVFVSVTHTGESLWAFRKQAAKSLGCGLG